MESSLSTHGLPKKVFRQRPFSTNGLKRIPTACQKRSLDKLPKALKVFKQRLKKSLYPRLARMSFDKDCDENVFITLLPTTYKRPTALQKKFRQMLRDRPNGSKTLLVGSACLSKRHLGMVN
ncbi:hypothetical protein YC2023_109459 [Brassica napus]